MGNYVVVYKGAGTLTFFAVDEECYVINVSNLNDEEFDLFFNEEDMSVLNTHGVKLSDEFFDNALEADVTISVIKAEIEFDGKSETMLFGVTPEGYEGIQDFLSIDDSIFYWLDKDEALNFNTGFTNGEWTVLSVIEEKEMDSNVIN